MEAWILEERQDSHSRVLLLGVFSTPELAVRWLRKTSKDWPDRPKTGGFVRVTDHLWRLGSYGDPVNYFISCHAVDDPPPLEREDSTIGATA